MDSDFEFPPVCMEHNAEDVDPSCAPRDGGTGAPGTHDSKSRLADAVTATVDSVSPASPSTTAAAASSACLSVEVVRGPCAGMDVVAVTDSSIDSESAGECASTASVLLGRSKAADLRLVGDAEVSGRHARVVLRVAGTPGRDASPGRKLDVELTVTDLGSTNGTVLDGKVLKAHTPVPLRPGQRLSVGTCVLNATYVVGGDTLPGGKVPHAVDTEDTAVARQPTVEHTGALTERNSNISNPGSNGFPASVPAAAATEPRDAHAGCPTCGRSLAHMTLAARTEHANACLDAGGAGVAVTAACPICGKDLSSFTATRREQHANRCVALVSEGAAGARPPAAPAAKRRPPNPGDRALVAATHYFCDRCGKDLSSARPVARINHIRTCTGEAPKARARARSKGGAKAAPKAKATAKAKPRGRRAAKRIVAAQRAASGSSDDDFVDDTRAGANKRLRRAHQISGNPAVRDVTRAAPAPKRAREAPPEALDSPKAPEAPDAAELRPDSVTWIEDILADGMEDEGDEAGPAPVFPASRLASATGAAASSFSQQSPDKAAPDDARLAHPADPVARRARGVDLWSVASLTARPRSLHAPSSAAAGVAALSQQEESWARRAPACVRSAFPAWRENLSFMFAQPVKELTAALQQLRSAASTPEDLPGSAAPEEKAAALEWMQGVVEWLVQRRKEPATLVTPAPSRSGDAGAGVGESGLPPVASPLTPPDLSNLASPVLQRQAELHGVAVGASMCRQDAEEALSTMWEESSQATGTMPVARLMRALRRDPDTLDRVLLRIPVHLDEIVALVKARYRACDVAALRSLLDAQGVTYSTAKPGRGKGRYR